MSIRRLGVFGFLLSTWLGALGSPDARAAMVINGGFEDPAVAAGNFTNIAVGGEAGAGFTGWTVGSGDIDVVNATAPLFGIDWGAQGAIDGSNILDLNGFNVGSIYQDIATVAGQAYELSFWYTNNPLGAAGETADVKVTDTGTSTSIGTLAIAHSSATLTDPDWKKATLTFVATGTMTRIEFASTSNPQDASGGIVLDAVAVNPSAVPEPATLLMAGVGLAGLGLARRRRRQ